MTALVSTLHKIRTHLGWMIFILILAIILALGGWRYYNYQIKQSWQPARIEPVGEEIAKLVDKVGGHVVLPQDEEPTIATVTSADLLKNQQFFASAKAGDTVLIYKKAKLVILYNPTLDRVLNMAPLVE